MFDESGSCEVPWFDSITQLLYPEDCIACNIDTSSSITCNQWNHELALKVFEDGKDSYLIDMST